MDSKAEGILVLEAAQEKLMEEISELQLSITDLSSQLFSTEQMYKNMQVGL